MNYVFLLRCLDDRFRFTNIKILTNAPIIKIRLTIKRIITTSAAPIVANEFAILMNDDESCNSVSLDKRVVMNVLGSVFRNPIKLHPIVSITIASQNCLLLLFEALLLNI